METGEQRDGLQLDYAPASSVRRIRRRRIVLFVLLLVFTAGTWKWGATVRRPAAMLYWQRQCLTYTAPPDMIVYEEDRAAAAVLLSKSSTYSKYLLHRGEPGSNPPTINAAAFSPGCWIAFISSIAHLKAGPIGFRGVTGTILLPPGSREAMVFLHERTSPSGHRRLVVVQYFPETPPFSGAFITGYNYRAEAITPATISTSPSVPPRGYAFSVLTGWFTPPLARMFAGQVDPSDVSHFTIAYQMWGKRDTFDGWLDDADNVTLTPRHSPEHPKE